MKLVLFVCVGNSFRSQIAEAYFLKHKPDGWVALSAGVRPADQVHPLAIKLMNEEGVDISHHAPKKLDSKLERQATIGVVVCGGSECPLLHVKKTERWDIPDPTQMTRDDARQVRDQIKNRVMSLIQKIQADPSFE